MGPHRDHQRIGLAVLVALLAMVATVSASNSVVVRAGPIAVTIPAGWSHDVARGGYSGCGNGVVAIWFASSRDLAQQAGPGEHFLILGSGHVAGAIRILPTSKALAPNPNLQLRAGDIRPATPLGKNRYKAVAYLARQNQIGITLFFGSTKPHAALVYRVNTLLRSIRTQRHYTCH